MAAPDHEACEPPLLSWKGMQLWSVGCRAPAICEIFMGLKAKKLSNLISHTTTKKKKTMKKAKRRKRGTDDDDVDQVHDLSEEDSQPPRCPSLVPLPGRLSFRSSLDDMMPHRHSVSIECCGSSSNQLKRNSDATASNFKRSSDNLRRYSDASLHHLQRLSTSCSSPGGAGYERVWALEGAGDDGGLDYVLPRETKLGGGRRSDVSVQLGRQDSSMSAHRRSSCSSFSSSSSVASAASAVAAKLAGRRSSASSESEQRHLNQLLAGNQFLTHLTAAPVPSAMEHMRPSEGLLLDASVRCREAELKERIIFFL